MKYASLHHHSTFSTKDGYGNPDEHVQRAVELEMPAMALTEHGGVSSHVKLEQAAKGTGVKPLYGCELYTGPRTPQQLKWHLTVLAMDVPGYRNLLGLVSEGWRNFYYYPTVTAKQLRRYNQGLIVLSGCSGSVLACHLLGGKGVLKEDASPKRAIETALLYKEMLGDRFYLEVQPFPELPRAKAIAQVYEEMSSKLGIPLVATTDVHYPRPEDNEMQRVLHAAGRGGGTYEDQGQDWEYDVQLTHRTDRDVWRRLVACGMSRKAAEQAVLNTLEIAERCTVELPKMDRIRFTPSKEESAAMFRKWLREGWEFRGIDRMPNRADYVARVRREMPLIEQKDFVDYFLFTSDLVKWAKDNGVFVGPARGSAAASLVCYLLRITEVDPVKYPHLLFERFIDITREDLPDIDLDFDDDLRYKVRDYLVAKYGEDRVGTIGNFVRYKGKNSLAAAGLVHRVPKYEMEAFKELLLERSSGDLRASATIEDTVAMFPQAKEIYERHKQAFDHAMRLEGNLESFGVHAAGLVVGTDSLENYVATYERMDNTTKTVRRVLSVDKYDGEYLGVMKADILSLSNCGLLRLALEMLGMTVQELYDVPLDDPATIQGFRDNDVVGIFQFDGRAQRSVNGEVRPDDFNELAAINALARPGPLHSGAASNYIQVKRGAQPEPKVHPLVDEITAWTHGVVVYQEQILAIVSRVGGFGIWEASTIRRIISQKKGEQAFNRYEQQFVTGAKAKGIDEATALRVWRGLITAGAYAFNAAHSYSYAMLGYWTMWLKRHHPYVFFCAALQKLGDKEDAFGRKKHVALLRDAVKHGIEVYPPDLNFSYETWSLELDEAGQPCGLRAGLSQLPGIGARAAADLVAVREKEGGFFNDYQHAQEARFKGAAYTKRTLAIIQEHEDAEDPFGLEVLGRQLNQVRAQLRRDETQEHLWPTHTAGDIPYEPRRDNVVWVGVVVARNLKDLFELHYSRTGAVLDPASVKDPHLVNWVVMLGEDDVDVVTLTVNRWRYGAHVDGHCRCPATARPSTMCPNNPLKEEIWRLHADTSLVLVEGTSVNQFRRAVDVRNLRILRQ